jgi:hypothetical protein
MTLVHVRGPLETGRRRVGEEAFDLGAQGRLVGLHGEEIVGLRVPDRRCDGDRLKLETAVNPNSEPWCLALKTCYPVHSLIE